MKKQLVTAGIAAAVGVAGVTGLTVVNAAPNGDQEAQRTQMMDAFADKFNLNKDEVQSFMSQQREQRQTERHAEREAEVTAAINQLVKDGKLTQEQADKLNAKRAEMQKEMQSLRDADMTREERREAMQTHRDDMQKWAEENGIDLTVLHEATGAGSEGRGHGGQGKHYGRSA